MELLSAFGLSTSAGLNAYIPLLAISLMARYTSLLKLSEPYNLLTDPWIIAILVFLILVEFFADKFPAVNHVNDLLQTAIRPIAGAIAFAASANILTNVHPVLSLALGLILAGSIHIAKSAVIRPMVTATTGGLGNIPVSFAEDFLSSFMSFIAIAAPILVIVVTLIVFVAAYALWKFFSR